MRLRLGLTLLALGPVWAHAQITRHEVVSPVPWLAQNGCGTVSSALPHTAEYPLTVRIKNQPIGFAVSERTARVFVVSASSAAPYQRQPMCSGTVSTLDARTGKVLRSVDVGTYPGLVAVDDRTGRVFVMHTQGQQAGTVTVFDGRSSGTVAVVRGAGCPCSLVVAQRTGRVFASSGGRIRMLDAGTGRVVRTLEEGGALALDDSRRRVYVANKPVVSVLDAASGRRVDAWNVGVCGGDAAIDQRLGRLYTASRGLALDRYNPQSGGEGYFCVIDTVKGKVIHRESMGRGGSAKILAVDEPAGIVLLYRYGDLSGTVRVLDAESGRARSTVLPLDPQIVPAVDAWTGRIFFMGDARYDTAGHRAVASLLALDPHGWRTAVVAANLPIPSALIVAASSRRVFLGGDNSVTVICADPKC